MSRTPFDFVETKMAWTGEQENRTTTIRSLSSNQIISSNFPSPPTTGTKLFEIVHELTTLVIQPPPHNPFAIDFQYFDTLPTEERVIRIAAMVDFLQHVYAGEHAYADEGNCCCCASPTSPNVTQTSFLIHSFFPHPFQSSKT